MHKLFTLFKVILCTSLTLNAQSSKEEYEKSVDYCACKIAYAYTEDFAFKNPNLDEKRSFEDVISTQLNDCDKKNISTSQLEILLKQNNFNGFSKILIPDTEKAKSSYSGNFNKEQAINSILTSFNPSLDKIDIKSELSDGLNNKLQSFTTIDNAAEKKKPITKVNSNYTEEINRLEQLIISKKEEKFDSFIPNWLLLGLLLSSFIILFIYNYVNNKKLNERIDRRLSKSEYEQTKISSNQSSNRNVNNSRFERDINQKILDLNIAIERLQNTKTFSTTPSSQKTSPIKKTPQSIQKEIQKFVYAKTPISDKVFNASDVTENKDGKFYKFLIKDNNQAEFEFYNTENSAIRAVNAPDSFLYPACEETEPLNQNAKRIITNKPGIVIKRDDKWIVKEKAQITYE